MERFEKRERPPAIVQGHRDAILDCLYKNTNTGDVRNFCFSIKKNKR